MKKLITSLALCLVSAVSFSQITELQKPTKQTKVGMMGAVLISCDTFENVNLFQFDDSRYRQIKVPVTFTLDNSEFEELYKALSEKFAKETFTEDEAFVMTTKSNIRILFKFTKMMGTKSVRFSVEKNGILSLGSYLTQKQIKKLFDKTN